MSWIRARWVRLGLAGLLLLIIGLAAYPISMSIWAQRQLDAAAFALERYDYWQAGQYLERYLAARPTDASAHFLAGQTARRRGDFPEALRQYQQAEQQGASREALATERELLSIQQGDGARAGRLAQLCAEHPEDAEVGLAFEVLIESAFRTLNVSQARWAVDLWLKHRPRPADQAQGLIWRGRTQELAQDLPEALADYRQALELTPDNAQARLRLAEALIRQEPREAASQLEWLRWHRPEDPEVQFQTARLHRNLGQPEEAGRVLDRLLARAPDRIPYLVERGRVAMDLHRPQEGERWLLQARELAPEQREVNLALADCLRQAGRPDEAKHYQEHVQAIDARLKQAIAELKRKDAG